MPDRVGERSIVVGAEKMAHGIACGLPPRLTPWAVRNSLGLPTGAFWLPTWPKMSRLIEFHGFLPFLRRICALIPIPVEPIAPRIREWSPQPSKAGVAPISIRGKARLETRLTPQTPRRGRGYA